MCSWNELDIYQDAYYYQNIYITDNPTISFFKDTYKILYRKYIKQEILYELTDEICIISHLKVNPRDKYKKCLNGHIITLDSYNECKDKEKCCYCSSLYTNYIYENAKKKKKNNDLYDTNKKIHNNKNKEYNTHNKHMKMQMKIKMKNNCR
jgi:hypothetical protein